MVEEDFSANLRKTHQDRICFWCNESVINCKDDCQCTVCSFDSEFRNWKNSHEDIFKLWINKNAKFHLELAEESIVEENQLEIRWRKRQLPLLSKINTKIRDWIKGTDFVTHRNQYDQEVLHMNSSDNHKIKTPYYDYVKKDKPLKFVFHCQLCGQDIKKIFFIKNKERKLAIGIGGNCGIAFYYAILIGNYIRKTMNKKVNKLFNDSIPKIIKTMENEIKKDIPKSKELWCKEILIRIDKHKKEKPLGPMRISQMLRDIQKSGMMSFYD